MPKTNTLVKICGLTSEEQALQVAKLGANAIGIISVQESPRYVSAEKKKKIFKIFYSIQVFFCSYSKSIQYSNIWNFFP